MVRHERRPGIGMLAGWRGHEEDKQGMGAPNRRQLDRYIENGCFWRGEIPEKARFYRFANRDFFDWAIPRGLPRQAAADRAAALFRAAAQVPARGRGPRHAPAAGPSARARQPRLRSAADLVSAVRRAGGQRRLSCCTRSPSARCTCIIPGARRTPGCARSRRAIRCSSRASCGERLGLADGDWVWIESPHGQVKAELKLMEGVNQDTVWTWNAIGKRSGAWNLSADRAGSHEGLPAQPRDLRAAAAAAGRASLRQHRSGDRAGGVVRPQGALAQMRAGGGAARPRRAFDTLDTKLPKPGR